MANVIALGERHGPSKTLSFERAELRQLLQIYARRVACGEWRDYAIQYQPGRAAFAVFRSAFDRPLYVFAKHKTGMDRHGDWVVTHSGARVARGRTLDDVLRKFDRRLSLVT
jgi:Protein of unknown function (DUF2794)